MPYKFNTMIDQHGIQSLKWDTAEHELPLWGTDMDFQTAPEIAEAIQERAAHGVFGCGTVPDKWYVAIQDWWKERHNFTIEKDWLRFSIGVEHSVFSIIGKLTAFGENVLMQTPVCNIGFDSVRDHGRQALESPLRYINGEYHIDFDALEQRLSDPRTTLMVLCNPHDPVGKVWDRETLERIGELCWMHHVLVLSDETCCDLTNPGCTYIPFASVSEHCAQNSITCLAPSKAFNLAGLQSSAVAVPNPVLRYKVWQALSTDKAEIPNCFAIVAAVAAFNEGGPWLDTLQVYLLENKKAAEEWIAQNLPQVKVTSSQTTHLLWLDCGKISWDSTELAQYIREKTGLCLSAGNAYGGNGNQFLRLNIACPKERLMEGLNRLKAGVLSYEDWNLSRC